MTDNTIDQWARAALNATGHSDQQIEAMKKPKPQLAAYIPPSPYSLEYATKIWPALNAAKAASAKIKRDQEDKLTAADAKIAEAEEEAEKWQKRSSSLESQIEGLFKAQHRH
jgi:hypothetical protein